MFKRLLGGCVAAGSFFSAVTAPAYAAEKPYNFLVILLDDVGWHDLGFTGNTFIETPNMDRLAAQGMRFATAYATHPYCAPSRQSLITGEWPARTAWLQRSELSDPDAPMGAPPYSPVGIKNPSWTRRHLQFISLAGKLKSAGYTTGHFGKWHFGEIDDDVSPENTGFDVSFGGAQRVGAVKNFFAPFDGLPGAADVKSRPGEYLTDLLTDKTIQFIKANKDHPFYVQLWHYAAHTPIEAPETVVEKYRKKRQRMGDNALNPTYAAMIDCADQGLGRILNVLSELGLSDNTVIFLTSDNGGVGNLGAVSVDSMAPLRGHKGLIYEGGVRVPLAIYWPGHPPADSVTDIPVSLIDLYPTILDMAHVPLPQTQPVDGQSLVPLLTTGVQPGLNNRPLFWYNPTHGVEPDGAVFTPTSALRKGNWRLVKNFGRPLELYDLKSDPAESVNLAQSHPEMTKELEQQLDGWLKDTGIVTPRPNPYYNPDYVTPKQVANTDIPADAKAVRSWTLDSASCGWSVARMVKLVFKDRVMQMHADGFYPEILTRDVAGLPSGHYAVQAELRVETGGQIRFHWQGNQKDKGDIDFYPQRDGKWHTLTGVFEPKEPLSAIRLAAPAHLNDTGSYDPETQPDYIEVRSIKLFELPAKD